MIVKPLTSLRPSKQGKAGRGVGRGRLDAEGREPRFDHILVNSCYVILYHIIIILYHTILHYIWQARQTRALQRRAESIEEEARQWRAESGRAELYGIVNHPSFNGSAHHTIFRWPSRHFLHSTCVVFCPRPRAMPHLSAGCSGHVFRYLLYTTLPCGTLRLLIGALCSRHRPASRP